MITQLAYLVMVLGAALMLWGLASAAANRVPGKPQLLFTAGIEVVVVVQSLIALIAIAAGARPVETATTVGYLIGIMVLLPIAFFWANNERTRFSGVVLAVAGLAVAVMALRLVGLWTFA